MLLGINMQTSFMHPPFGFALFYLRSVAAAQDYVDKLTGKVIAKVTTGQIYWGAVPFVVIQLIMVGLVIAFPTLVTGNLVKSTVDPSKIEMQIPPSDYDHSPSDRSPPDFGAPDKKGDGQAGQPADKPGAPADSSSDLEKLFKESK